MQIRFSDSDNYIPVLEACIIGLVAGLSAVLLSAGVNWLGALRVHLSSLFPAYFVLPGIGLVGGYISGLLVEKIAPEASGSGIPQVRAWLDRVMMPLDFRIALAKLLGGTIALGSGLFLGKEGPTVQLGAALANPLSRFLPTTTAHKRQLIAAGAGAGLTAAFNAPIAGVIFVLEELLKEIKPSTVIIATVACAVSALVLQTFWPPHVNAVVSPLSQAVKFSPIDIPFIILLGILTGLAGAMFNSHILAALNFNRKVLKIPTSFKVALAGMLSGGIISLLPTYFHNYAGMRALIVTGETSYITVLLGLVGFYLLTLIAYGSGAPGGLFAPSLAIGSALGYLVGYFEQTVLGTGSTVLFALVGMGAFFSGVARVPLTAIVITFELTTNFTLLTPLMLACVISSTVGDLVFKGSLYDLLMRWNNINLRGPHTNETLHVLKAKDIMHRKFETIYSNQLVKEMLSALNSSTQHGFPVLKGRKLVGVITEADLFSLGQGEGMSEMKVSDVMTAHPVAISPLDSLEDILLLFSRHKFKWLPVIHNDKLTGIVLQTDVVNALFSQEEKASEISGAD